MSWVWLSPPSLDFGEQGGRDGAELTVWLHADPYGFLQVAPDSDRVALRRAYRRAARGMHPDVGADEEAFRELQGALAAAIGDDDAEVTVAPRAGAWWSFAGFVEPATPEREPGRGAVAGLLFELHDLDSIPLRRAHEVVRVSYRGQVMPLALAYSRSARAVPVLRAKAATLLESAILALLCLVVIPFLAVVVSLETYFFSGGSAWLFWSLMLATVGLGYGALAVILGTAGRPLPDPRRAIRTFRGRRPDRRLTLPRGPS